MFLNQEVPQNFTYTSRATEMGRATKTKKMDKLPEWTPGPGEYAMPTDFVKKTEMVNMYPDIEGENEYQEEVVRWD